MISLPGYKHHQTKEQENIEMKETKSKDLDKKNIEMEETKTKDPDKKNNGGNQIKRPRQEKQWKKPNKKYGVPLDLHGFGFVVFAEDQRA